jgi:hypothetical protein
MDKRKERLARLQNIQQSAPQPTVNATSAIPAQTPVDHAPPSAAKDAPTDARALLAQRLAEQREKIQAKSKMELPVPPPPVASSVTPVQAVPIDSQKRPREEGDRAGTRPKRPRPVLTSVSLHISGVPPYIPAPRVQAWVETVAGVPCVKFSGVVGSG